MIQIAKQLGIAATVITMTCASASALSPVAYAPYVPYVTGTMKINSIKTDTSTKTKTVQYNGSLAVRYADMAFSVPPVEVSVDSKLSNTAIADLAADKAVDFAGLTTDRGVAYDITVNGQRISKRIPGIHIDARNPPNPEDPQSEKSLPLPEKTSK